MSDWTWEYVPDADSVVGGLTRAQIDEGAARLDACMARNGYESAQPDDIWQQYTRDILNATPPAGSATNAGTSSPRTPKPTRS